jgi:pimeloyl-ACP methyl ester carboxylesterase
MVLGGFAGSIVKKLVINDIGPYVSSTGLKRIGEYVNQMPSSFATIGGAESYIRSVLAPYGKLADEHWRHLTQHSVRWDEPSQQFKMLCDPLIGKTFKYPWSYPLDLWKYWEAIEAPTLVLQGAKSDLLSRELTLEMKRRNGCAEVVRFDDCGHVPPLMASDQIEVLMRFLEGVQSG